MRGKSKKYVVFLMIFVMILGTSIGSYAQSSAAETQSDGVISPGDNGTSQEISNNLDEELPSVEGEEILIGSEDPIESGDPIESEDPVESEKPAESEEPTESEEPAESEELTESEEDGQNTTIGEAADDETPELEKPLPEGEDTVQMPTVTDPTEVSYEIQYLILDTGEKVPGLELLEGIGEVGEVIGIPYPEVEGYDVADGQPTELVLDKDEELNRIKVYYEEVAVKEFANLVINHIILLEEDEELIESEQVENLKVGETVYPEDYVFEDGNLTFLYGDFSELKLVNGLNIINLYYEEFTIGDNPDNLADEEISRGESKADSFYYPRVQRTMGLLSNGGLIWPNPGSLNLTKEAEPIGGSETKWKVKLTIEGKNLPMKSDVVLVIDKSGSMAGSRMTNTILAAKQFVDKLLLSDKATRIAVVSFDKNANIVSDFVNFDAKDSLKNQIGSISANGGTNMQAGIRQAQILLDSSQADNKYIVFLGDGEPTYSYKVTEASGITLSAHNKNQTPTINYNNPQITGINYNTIVGSGSAYTLSSSYRYQIPCTVPGHNHGPWTTTFPANNGIPTIYEAGLAKDKGTKIYSIALEAGSNGNTVLNGIQNAGYYQLNSSDLGPLSGVYDKIAGSIAFAAQNGRVEDPMGDMFNLVSTESQIEVSQGSITKVENGTIYWNVGNIAEGTGATMEYVVEIKAGADAGEKYPTNKETVLYYKDANDNDTSKKFEIPEVSIGGGSILIKGYLVNEEGEPINEEGVVVDRPDLAKRLFDHDYSGTPLPYNITYTVSQPGYSGYQYMKYVWNETIGSSETVDVSLQSNKPTQIVWFGYKEEDTAYKVEHYQKDVGAATYTLADTDNLTGTTGDLTAATAKTYIGFTVQAFTQETIAADGSTVVKIYYDRNSYTLTYKDSMSTVIYATETYEFGEEITPIGEPTKSGYTFSGWLPTIPTTMPAMDIIVEAMWAGMEVTKVGTYNGDAEKAEVGDTISYTITVKNTGNTTLTNIPVIDSKIGLN
ncbi:MAG: VWA domain-containing protein, partial [Natronincolaceae bacterium]